MLHYRYYFLVFIFFLLLSCSPYHHLAKYNYVNKSRLINTKAKITVQYFGDTHFGSLEQIDKTSLRSLLKKYPFLRMKDILAFSETTIAPRYAAYLFLNEYVKDIDTLEFPIKDTLAKSVLFQTANNQKRAYLLLIRQDSITMKSVINDGEEILKSIRFKIDSSNALTYSSVFENVRDDINYLRASKKLINAPVEDSLGQDWMQYQFLTTINSFVQNNIIYDSLINVFEQKRIRKQKINIASIDTSKIYHDTAAFSKISQESKSTNVVMVNENHWYPKHRIFTIQLLKKLKKNGFNYLALEALSSSFQASKITEERPYPTLSAGYYIQEPYFAHLIRIAKELGYKIIAYESSDMAVDRELGQAKKLAAIIENDPKAKILVHAGIDHILEKPTKKGKRMAVYLKEITGINPLTINQVEIIDKTTNGLTLIPFDELPPGQEKINDYYVINNIPTNLKNTYPEKEFKNYKLNLRNFNLETTLLAKIYNKEEFDIYKKNAVPVLNLKTKNSDDLEIALPVNDYVLIVLGEQGETSKGEISLKEEI